MKVMHLIDSLSAGGAERVAVNMVNTLNSGGVETYLCATRKEGPLKTFIVHADRYLFLNRKSRLNIRALSQLIQFIKKNHITILHAHSSSYFIAVLAKIITRSVKVVWHDHYGLSDQLESRKSAFIRLASIFFNAVFSVNNTLKNWAERKLFVKQNRISFLANYADLGSDYNSDWQPDRLTLHNILCLANLRPQKDHHTLLKAFRKIKDEYHDASLYLVGKDNQDAYSESLKKKVEDWKLKDVYFMGVQPDVLLFLEKASIGVLSSASEGLPIALLEYGLAGLPVICTAVGECRSVLDDGQAGWLIPAGDSAKLYLAMKDAFDHTSISTQYATRLKDHVQRQYSAASAQKKLMAVYKTIA
jgi:glycosyltransferase involved in cell wall biosynthesis